MDDVARTLVTVCCACYRLLPVATAPV